MENFFKKFIENFLNEILVSNQGLTIESITTPTSSHGTLSVASLNSDYGQLLSNDDDDNNGIIQQK
ncbi:hypothetical protein DERP_000897 [Dermatophagoides pteronyssinus]|uniref:Uncharacterized protein n=1 Tax=Dermatophagoides pteronyssinus TaxID=6956 RepID=A0ABQ8JCY3_DERPT|nr:hypothetical protein DERP_000897 [Dermatophagoides pteronyssinus]